MKRFAPILVTAALAVSVSSSAFAQERARTRTIQRTTVTTSDAVTGVVETATVGRDAVVLEPDAIRQSAPEGADTSGVARSTGAGIGETSTRSDVGSGRGGAGMNRSGTLAPPAIRERQVITTVPATTRRTRIIPGTSTNDVFIAPSGTAISVEPVIPRATTNAGTLGAGTSTPVGVAPGK